MPWGMGCAEPVPVRECDGLDRINRRVAATRIRSTGITAHTLDADASQIVAKKEAANFTYQGQPGYLPMIGHLAEAGELFDEAPKSPVIASNRIESAAGTRIGYRQRGEVSKNEIKELKIGFGRERLPCEPFAAHTAFFRIGVLAHAVRSRRLPGGPRRNPVWPNTRESASLRAPATRQVESRQPVG